MKNIGLYARYSDTKQDDGYSIEYQISECNEYLEKRGMELTKSYIDQAISATKVAGRDGFYELLNDVKNGLIDIVIVYKFNRIFRNSYESHKYRNFFKKHGVKLISVTQQVDDETSAGRLMINVLADIDQFQSETISDHVKSSMREMVKQGYFTGGTVPYGYGLETVENGKKTRKKYKPDDKEKEIVKKLFEMYANNYSLKQLQEYLKSIGAVSRRGKHFGTTTLARMLRNDFYIGTRRYSVEGSEPIVISNAVTPIIDIPLWNSVQKRHKENKPVTPRKRKGDIYSLTGKIICQKCNQHFFGIKSGSVQNEKKYEYKYYICCNAKTYSTCSCKRIRKDYIENIVLQEIKKHILNKDAIDKIADNILSQLKENPESMKAKLKTLRTQRKDLEMQKSELVRMKMQKMIDDATFIQFNQEVANQIQEADTKISALEYQTKSTISHEMIAEYLNNLIQIADKTDDETLDVIFNSFVESITVGDVDIIVNLFVHPLFDKNLEYKVSFGHPKWTFYSNLNR